MAVALPLGSLVLLVLAQSPVRDLGVRILTAAVVWGVLVAAITEAATWLEALAPGTLTGAWAAVALLAGLGAARRRPWSRWSWPRPARPSADELVLMAPTAGIALVTAVLAASGWPSQWDSMVYHLPRIDHWLQNRSVAFYPTHIVRQLFNPPWAEYAMLQLIATGGDERWGNAVQWLAMVGSLVGVALVARRLGAGRRGQLCAVLFCVTIRMGVMQASGTQNDYVSAFWLVCMAEALLGPASVAAAVRAGAAFGLAALSKGTAAVLGLPLLAVLWPWGALSWRTSIGRGAVAAALALALNASHFVRNQETFGSPLGPTSLGSATGAGDDNLVNQAMSPALFLSNVVRNLSLHAGTRWDALNAVVQRGIERGHARAGLDVDDPRTSRLYPLPHFEVDANPASPDRSGSPLHLAVLLAAVALGLVGRRRSTRYVLALLLAFAAFNLVFKWQPWHARLHLPLFVLAAPLVGVVAEPWRRVGVATGALLALAAVPPLVGNYLGPLDRRWNALNTPRIQQYFRVFREGSDPRQDAYVGAADQLRALACRDVGVLLGWDDWEHPLRVLLGPAARLRHVAVENPSAARGERAPAFTPCAVVVGSVDVGDALELGGESYRLTWSRPPLKILVRTGASASATVR